MIHLVVLVPVVLLSALVAALILTYRKLGLAALLLLVATLVLVPTCGWNYLEREFALESVPDALRVRAIDYRNEESWGFGPGGNEAGIRFYPLPEDVSRQAAAGGIAFFETLPPNADQQRRDWRGRYETWSETPIRGNDWKVDPATGLANVMDYICAYGFCIDVPADRLAQANAIVNQPGSFYARGRIGMIVVSPKQGTVLYFYNG
jgi:hypothetical protein